jgi:hypothetical protein
MRTIILLAGVVTLLCLSSMARAQAPFFGGGGATAFAPQIGVVNSGIILDAQATVSADRKYVTLTMRPQNASLLALRDFTFQNGVNPAQNFGFVGFPPPVNSAAAGAPATAPGNNRPTPKPAAPAVTVAPSILQREGMTRLNIPAAR